MFVRAKNSGVYEYLQIVENQQVADLVLHHIYRAMAWLGEPLPAQNQAGATPFAPRCPKERIEEPWFAQRRDLFSGLDLVLFRYDEHLLNLRRGKQLQIRGVEDGATDPDLSGELGDGEYQP